jgi:hypothetical protein
VREQALEDRDEERRSLAGTGLGLASNIAPGKSDGQGLALDRGATLEAGIPDALHDRWREVEVREAELGKMLISHFMNRPLQIGAEGAKIWARYSGTRFRAVPATQLLLKYVSVTV